MIWGPDKDVFFKFDFYTLNIDDSGILQTCSDFQNKNDFL